jgi:heme-degrading monooxygenase HmoA
MYGTISRFQIKPGHEGAVEDMLQGWLRDHAPGAEGFITDYLLTPATPAGERLVLTIFDSEASYRKNAAAPEQDAWYRQFRTLLEADPEWHDGEIADLVRATVPL